MLLVDKFPKPVASIGWLEASTAYELRVMQVCTAWRLVMLVCR